MRAKQMMPVYVFKGSIIHCPLMDGINEILIISTPHDFGSILKIIGRWTAIGCQFSYVKHR
jgi:glucose-1-phosphate thymidylyltransferase